MDVLTPLFTSEAAPQVRAFRNQAGCAAAKGSFSAQLLGVIPGVEIESDRPRLLAFETKKAPRRNRGAFQFTFDGSAQKPKVSNL